MEIIWYHRINVGSLWRKFRSLTSEGDLVTTRRTFIAGAASAAVAATALPFQSAAQTNEPKAATRPPGIGLASYSLWQFRPDRTALRALEKNLELAAEWGFDGLEILHRQ